MSNDSDDRGDQQQPYGQWPQQPAPYGAPAGYPGQHEPGQGYQPQEYPPQGYQAQAYPPQGYQAQGFQAQQPAPSNGMGIAGFVTALIGLLLCWVPFLGLILAACGIVLSAIGMSQGKRTGAGTGLAVAGLVLGILAVIPALIFLVAVLSVSTAP